MISSSETTLNRSVCNSIKELRALKNILLSSSEEERRELVEEGLDEIIYNLGLSLEGVEYVSDEYQFLEERYREC